MFCGFECLAKTVQPKEGILAQAAASVSLQTGNVPGMKVSAQASTRAGTASADANLEVQAAPAEVKQEAPPCTEVLLQETQQPQQQQEQTANTGAEDIEKELEKIMDQKDPSKASMPATFSDQPEAEPSGEGDSAPSPGPTYSG